MDAGDSCAGVDGVLCVFPGSGMADCCAGGGVGRVCRVALLVREGEEGGSEDVAVMVLVDRRAVYDAIGAVRW